MLTNIARIKFEGKVLIEFGPEGWPEAAAHLPPPPDVPQPQPQQLDPAPPLPPVEQPVMAGENLEAVERLLRAHREETRQLVQDSMELFGRRMEGDLRGMSERLTRCEGQGPSGAKRPRLDLLRPEEIKKERDG